MPKCNLPSQYSYTNLQYIALSGSSKANCKFSIDIRIMQSGLSLSKTIFLIPLFSLIKTIIIHEINTQ